MHLACICLRVKGSLPGSSAWHPCVLRVTSVVSDLTAAPMVSTVPPAGKGAMHLQSIHG